MRVLHIHIDLAELEIHWLHTIRPRRVDSVMFSVLILPVRSTTYGYGLGVKTVWKFGVDYSDLDIYCDMILKKITVCHNFTDFVFIRF